MSASPGVPSYGEYLKLDRLLALQSGLEDDERAITSDELHFIIVHQAYELWFKLVLAELRLARDHLARPRVAEEAIPYVVHHLGRVSRILGLLVQQFEVMETLTPQDFLAFRDKLAPASGFQSFQMRALERLLGQPGAEAGETTLHAALLDWLERTPIQGSSPGDPGDAAVVDGFLAAYLERQRARHAAQAARMASVLGVTEASIQAQLAETAARAATFFAAAEVDPAQRPRARRARAGLLFIESYRELPLLAWPRTLVDSVVALEEGLVLWRGRHARMVERIIGRRLGTGGSPGVEYLDQTTRTRIFTELWEVRTHLLAREDLPPLAHPERYGFVTP